MTFHQLLREPITLLDGAMGTMLLRDGLPAGELPELLNLTDPERILSVHRAYARAGSQILYANTFGANRFKLAKTGRSVAEVVEAGVGLARRAAEETDALVALDIGALGQMLEPAGTLTFDEAVALFRESVEAGVRAGADLIVIETMSDLGEMRAALLAAKEAGGGRPVMGTMSFGPGGRTFTGCGIPSMALTLEGMGADAIGVNCSLGPEQMEAFVEELAAWTTRPIVVKPNAGLPDPVTNVYELAPDRFAAAMRVLVDKGARIVGGCCGTTPEHIAALKDALSGVKPGRRAERNASALCTASHFLPLDRPRLAGARIGTVGEKSTREKSLFGDMDDLLDQALDQVDEGVELLVVDVDPAAEEAPSMMAGCVRELQGMAGVPLMLLSSRTAVLEAGLRSYHGRAIAGPVTGDDASMEAVFPLAARYGAAVIGLTVNRDGVPPTVDGRVSIAERILARAAEWGLPRERVIIDCVAPRRPGESEEEMLRALRKTKERFGVRTALGTPFSPECGRIGDPTLLARALASGLDVAILDPGEAALVKAVQDARR